jgi:peptidoglycan hydrolase CwlO-like protein
VEKNAVVKNLGEGRKMKSQIFLWILMIFVLVLLGLGYAQMIQMEQATSQKIGAVEGQVGRYDAAIKGLEAEMKTASTAVKGFEARIASGETQSRNADGKVENLIKEVADMKSQLAEVIQAKAAPAPAPVAAAATDAAATPPSDVSAATQGSVELGTIPVQK